MPWGHLNLLELRCWGLKLQRNRVMMSHVSRMLTAFCAADMMHRGTSQAHALCQCYISAAFILHEKYEYSTNVAYHRIVKATNTPFWSVKIDASVVDIIPLSHARYPMAQIWSKLKDLGENSDEFKSPCQSLALGIQNLYHMNPTTIFSRIKCYWIKSISNIEN